MIILKTSTSLVFIFVSLCWPAHPLRLKLPVLTQQNVQVNLTHRAYQREMALQNIRINLGPDKTDKSKRPLTSECKTIDQLEKKFVLVKMPVLGHDTVFA